MSLVGYGSSDSSGSSDEEDNHLPSSGEQKTTNAANGVSKQQNRKEEQQQAITNGSKSDDVSVDKEEGDLRGNNLFKVLPKPQKKQTEKVEISEGDLEDIVKPKSSQKTSLPKPLPLLKGSHVKITIPALDSDSDDEEEVVTKKKMKFSGKSRLLDILPPPKHFSVKQSNRTFIPYTLNKRPEPAESATKKPPSSSVPKKPAVKKNILGVTGYNSDDDDDDDDSNVNSSNFFSLDSKPQIPRQTDGPFTQPSATISSSISSTFHSLSSIPSVPWQQTTISPHVPSATDVVEKNYAEYYGQLEESVQPDQESLATHDDDPELEGPSMNIDTLLQDEQFQRLQGKNQRGKEQIQLMNVNADDFIDKSLLTKTLTQEMPKHSYKKNKDAPSKKSRNKHQITYLAYQAKERELELKNQWSQNKMTKRQTQAKYGF